ncbi:MAG: signal peptidase I [Flavobacteriales bacterium]
MMKIYILLFLTLLTYVGLAKLFSKAGEKGWKAFIPFYNYYVWLKIVQRPVWWLVLVLIPIVNIVLTIGLIVEILNCFGKRSRVDHILGVLFPFAYLPYIAYYENVEFRGVVDYSKIEKSKTREWSEAIFFAVIAAMIIRTFGLEAFRIPSPSMENTLKTGDFLFVSKFHYGPKTPITPLSVPFAHQTLPVLEIPAYLDWIELPSFRLPGLKDVERRDIIVFNYPYEPYRPIDKKTNYVKRCVGIPGDSLQVKQGYVYVNGVKEDFPKTALSQDTYDAPSQNPQYFELVHPMEFGRDRKKMIDVLSSVQAHSGSDFFSYSAGNWTMLNNGPFWVPQENTSITLNDFNYYEYRKIFKFYEKGNVLYLKDLVNSYNELKYLKDKENFENNEGGLPLMCNQLQDRLQFAKLPYDLAEVGDRFYMQNSPDNPEKYMKNLSDYIGQYITFCQTEIPGELEKIKEAIKKMNPEMVEANGINVEKVKAQLQTGKNLFLVNGVLADKYTFKQNYYFAMGDNRGHSADSREWGFVPEDHIVGTPVFIWMSANDGLKFERMFCFVSSEGVSRSYLFHFLIGGVVIWLISKFWKNKKSKEKK